MIGKRRTLLFLIVVIVLVNLLLVSCQTKKSTPTQIKEDDKPDVQPIEVPIDIDIRQELIDSYIDGLENGQYEKIYALLSSAAQSAITKDAFIARHHNIYSGIGLEQMSLQLEERLDMPLTSIFQYTVRYSSKKVGDLSFSIQMPLHLEDERWGVHWTPAFIFPSLEHEDKVLARTLYPKRGRILDNKGKVLAETLMAETVFINLAKFSLSVEKVNALSSLLDMQKDEVEKIITSKEAKRDGVALLKSFLPGKLTDTIKTKLIEIVGVGIDGRLYKSVRYYPYDESLSHFIGYTGLMNEHEWIQYVDKGYRQEDRVGRIGIEQEYEAQLRGENGYDIFIQTSDGKKKETLSRVDVKNGLDIALTVDIALQQQVEQIIRNNIPGHTPGAVVILNPLTGAIDAISSFPEFDLNWFGFKLSQERWDYLNSTENNNPLFNRALQGLYAPGSVYKVFTAAMALDAGVITTKDIFPYEIVDNRWKPIGEAWNYPPITRMSSYDGAVNLSNAMIHSDNIYYAYLALLMGDDSFLLYLDKYGLLSELPFELKVKKPQLMNQDSRMNRKLLADSGYGQGEVLITPLQITSVFSGLFNQGSIASPRLVKDSSIMIWKEGVYSEEAVHTLSEMLQKVSTAGTGKRVGLAEVIMAKTGTAEISNNKSREISWYIGYMPDKQRLICIMLEVESGKGESKFDVAREIFKLNSLE